MFKPGERVKDKRTSKIYEVILVKSCGNWVLVKEKSEGFVQTKNIRVKDLEPIGV